MYKYWFDDHPPQYPNQYYTVIPQSSDKAPISYQWLEKYLSYCNNSENGVHWFIRFK